MTVVIRQGAAQDDAVCACIVGALAGDSAYVARLPHAQGLFEDDLRFAWMGNCT